MLDQVAALTVPHSYFTSFYYVSTLLSIFWASQLISRGPAFRAVSAYCEPRNEHDSVSFDRVLVTWTLMLAQGSRRLYESLTLSGPSKSRMWVGHWVLGLAYYAGASIAVWVEGICKPGLSPTVRQALTTPISAVLQSHEYSLSDLTIKAPSLRSIVAILIFILASGLQHDCHAYLFSLKTKTKSKSEGGEYTLPTHPAFTRIIVPHYTAECLVYFALALIAAPSSSWGLNGTLACVLVFVVVNLGVTAEGTREWYVQKFGHDKIAGRWRMLPGVW